MDKILWYIKLNTRPYRIIRDVLLVEVLCFLGGFLVGFTASVVGDGVMPDWPIASMVLAPIGLSIVGAINPNNRWYHLAIVTAILFATTCLVNSFTNVKSIGIYTYLIFLYHYVIGGLLSKLYPVFRNREQGGE